MQNFIVIFFCKTSKRVIELCGLVREVWPDGGRRGQRRRWGQNGAVQIKVPELFFRWELEGTPTLRTGQAKHGGETRHARPMKGCVVRAWVLVLVCFVGTCLLGSFPCAVLESYKQSSVRVRRDTRKNRELVHAGLGAQLCHYHQGRREELRMMRALAVSSNFFFCRIPHPCDYLQLS